MALIPCLHKVHYYETDKMGIVHHSNYIRWMEEARVFFLEQIGFPFDALEEMGIGSPVVSLSCRYLVPTRFPEEIAVVVTVLECRGAKLVLSYEMTNAAGQIVFTATSDHGFLTTDGQPVNLKKAYPDFYAALVELILTS